MSLKPTLVKFQELVLNKFHVFNSLFTNLPYEKITDIGMLIPILGAESKRGFEEGKNPLEIIDTFFERHTRFTTVEEKNDFLFRIIQYIERQVVLFDAIEDAAFADILKVSDTVNMERVALTAAATDKTQALKDKLDDFAIRIVFTAHPTQFYPEAVQYLIEDLRDATAQNDIGAVNDMLLQLGKTSFLNREKPSPYDEAMSIIYYLRTVYYQAVGRLHEKIRKQTGTDNYDLIKLGFWPGGDRDGNPFVTADITRKVADELRTALFKSYYHHLKLVRRRLTFKGINEPLDRLQEQLYQSMFSKSAHLSYQDIIEPLEEARAILLEQHDGLFLSLLDQLIGRVKIFRTHFATLDIRQDSRKHEAAIAQIVAAYRMSDRPYGELSRGEKIKLLTETEANISADRFDDELTADTIRNVQQLRDIQRRNGEAGCHRYIISNSEDIFAVLHVYALFRWCGYAPTDIHFDIVPLFETMNGMDASGEVMQTLYDLPAYAAHIKARNMKQTIMLGFSDGTKDGGYLKANFEILRTKEHLSGIARENGIKVVFFDGRGGPPARGGGKSHRFYASQGQNVANNAIEITIQGQTITSMYGTVPQFMHNCEQLITAGVNNDLFATEKSRFTQAEKELMGQLGELAYEKYTALKNHPKFVSYLEEMSTLKYYGMAKIGSRPAKRGKAAQLTLDDLRAISFVGSWSQLKQNVPGYFGIGTALADFEKRGKLAEVASLFESNAFFKALVLNSMMSLSKTFFPLTSYMKEHAEYGPFWEILYAEYQLSLEMMLKITGYDTLMQEEPRAKASVRVREEIVLPLLTVQQYALQQIAKAAPGREVYEKMVMRSLYGNINASRNSA